MDKLKTVQANSSLPLPQPTLSVAGFSLTMVCVSTVSIVYNLRMDHYGVRKYRNIENQKISNCVSIRLPEETITSNFQLDRSNTKVGQPIQIKNLVFLPLTVEITFDIRFALFPTTNRGCTAPGLRVSSRHGLATVLLRCKWVGHGVLRSIW